MRAIGTAIALLALAGCASITAGTTESVEISTVPKSGANCQLANEKGRWSINPTPGSTSVAKAYGDLTITCTDKQGDEGSAVLQSHTAGAAFGNILLGGIIGAAVDMSSGAAYLYPSTTIVTLAPTQSATSHPVAVPALAPVNAGKPST